MEKINYLLIVIILALFVYLFIIIKKNKKKLLVFGLFTILTSSVITIVSFLTTLELGLFCGGFALIVFLSVYSCLLKKCNYLCVILFWIIELSLFIFCLFDKHYLIFSLLLTLIYFLSETNQKYLRKTYEESATEYQNKILNKQIEEVQNIYLTMRGWRHDYHNHLQSIKAYLMLKKYEEANKYLNDLDVDLQSVNQMVETGNISCDAIINSKLSLAKSHDISLNYKVIVPKTLVITDIDLCVLIGNLIDNAVEANDLIEEKKDRFIRLYIGVFKSQLYISCTNSTKELVRKLDEEYITNKRGNHGHGLKRINNIVNKYDGFINRKNEPGVFITEIMLPLNN